MFKGGWLPSKKKLKTYQPLRKWPPTGMRITMIKQNSAVLQLQREAANPDSKVSTLLRTAKIIATKLELKDFLKWIDKELKGYKDTPIKELPDYRLVWGDAYSWNPYHGWQQIMFQSAADKKALCFAPQGQSVVSLEDAILNMPKDSRIVSDDPEIVGRLLKGISYQANVQLRISEIHLRHILETVRDTILEWTLELEKAGVLGEDLVFTPTEKKEALPVTNYVTQNINNISGVSGEAKIEIKQTATTAVDPAKLTALVAEIEKNIGQLPQGKDEVSKELVILKEQSILPVEKQDTKKVNEALLSVRKICEGITSSVIAQGIVALIKHYFG